jgi:D-alanyl-D-alanine carboxypeptidase
MSQNPLRTATAIAFLLLLGLLASSFQTYVPEGRRERAEAAEAGFAVRLEPPPDLTARAALSVFVDPDGQRTTLYGKNEELPLPTASLVKLLTALVVVEHMAPDGMVTISQTAVAEAEDAGGFRVGERFLVRDLLAGLLVESSNDAAAALAETIGRETFIARMRETAASIGLRHTAITNFTGLDPALGTAPGSAPAVDLVTIATYLLRHHPEIFAILALPEIDLYDAAGTFHHRAINTNRLITDPDLPAKAIGGKTGETPLARQNLLLVLEAPGQESYTVHVILGSEDRFGEMKKLVQWAYRAHAPALQ